MIHSMPDKDSPPPASFWSLSTLLMIGLAACFTAQQVVLVYLEKPYDAYLALSGYGMKEGHLWELFTYQLFHGGQLLYLSLAHLLINLLGLWFLGRPVEARLGHLRFLLLYLGSSLVGALLQGAVALAGFWLPESLESVAACLRDRFGGPAAGASVGLCGVFAVWCLFEPERKIRLFFLIPIKAARLVWLALGIAVLLVVVSSHPDPTRVARNPDLAHLAHLGGLLAGLGFGKLGMRRVRASGTEVRTGAPAVE